MTKKNAKKTAARQRQQKTGQSYQSALRAESTMTDEERDNLVADAIREMGADEFWRRVREARYGNMEKRVNEAFTVLNNGLYHGGRNAPTREALYGRIQLALHVLAGSSQEKIKEAIDNGSFEPAPISSIPLRGWGLDTEVPISPLPKEVLDQRHLYERFYKNATVKDNCDPQKLMDYWKGLPEARRCTDSKQRLLGVTDDHPEKPLITWTTLTGTKGCPGFGEWWRALPESKEYDRASSPPFFALDEKGPWHDKTEFTLSPGDLAATWVEVPPNAKVQDSGLIRKFRQAFPKKLPGPAKVHVEFRTQDGEPWGQPHDLQIDAAEVLKGRYQTIQRAFELLRKECKDNGLTPDPKDIRYCAFAVRPIPAPSKPSAGQ